MIKKILFTIIVFLVSITCAFSGVLTTSTSSQDLSAAALSYTYRPSSQAQVYWITLKASAAITETVTISLDSLTGSAYDTVLGTVSIVAGTDMVWFPDGDLIIKQGDGILIQCTAAGGVNTVYVSVMSLEGAM